MKYSQKRIKVIYFQPLSFNFIKHYLNLTSILNIIKMKIKNKYLNKKLDFMVIMNIILGLFIILNAYINI